MPRVENGQNPATGLGGLDNVKALKILEIDEQTSAAILGGFDYEIDGRLLHFSYDSFDQQNFSDGANNSIAALMAGQPFALEWNSYDESGALVELELSAAQFLELYQQGACTHKVTKMAQARQRKLAVNDPATDTPEKVAEI
ncbi:MAG: hypothetical protein DELT_02669 [Desulfovibrio sp.]